MIEYPNDSALLQVQALPHTDPEKATGHSVWAYTFCVEQELVDATQCRSESLNNIGISRVLTQLKKSTHYGWLKDAEAT